MGALLTALASRWDEWDGQVPCFRVDVVVFDREREGDDMYGEASPGSTYLEVVQNTSKHVMHRGMATASTAHGQMCKV